MDLSDPTTIALLAAEALRAAGLRHALYGGLLLAAYGEPRETRDADFAVLARGALAARKALLAKGAHALIAFEDVTFGGLYVSRVTVLGGGPGDLNTVDLVRPRSDRFAAAVLDRSVTVFLRGTSVGVVGPEDFVLLKILSTRDRDLDDAASVLVRSGDALDSALIDGELALLSAELPDVDVAGRAAAVRARARSA